MTMNSLGNMDVIGSLQPDITIQNPMNTTSVYQIGDSFDPGASITLPANGLTGQITFNNNDSGGTWDGDVIVGATTLSPTNYTETAASLGGGAAGLVPFGLHGSSSSPVENGNINPLTNAPFSIRHYGPVDFTGAGAPITVSRRVVGDTGTTDQAAGFTYGVTGAGEHDLAATPVAGYQYQNGYEYVVSAITSGVDRLFCKNAVGDPGVGVYEYTFTVGTACPADINGDGVIDTSDLGILIGNFGVNGLSVAGDLNNDGGVDTADLGILIGQFGNTCGAAAAMGGGGPLVSPVLAEMGFTSVDSYIDWLDTLTTQECIDHVRTLIERIQAR